MVFYVFVKHEATAASLGEGRRWWMVNSVHFTPISHAQNNSHRNERQHSRLDRQNDRKMDNRVATRIE